MSCINDARTILGAGRDEGIVEVARRRMAELTELKEKVVAYENLGIDALRALAKYAEPQNTVTLRKSA